MTIFDYCEWLIYYAATYTFHMTGNVLTLIGTKPSLLKHTSLCSPENMQTPIFIQPQFLKGNPPDI